MVKKSAQDPADATLQRQIRQYVVSASEIQKQEGVEPKKVFQMRVFAKNTVEAKSKFWYQMRVLNKLKRAHGETLEIFERNTQQIKTFGILLKYQSRTAHHNMYKEFRDVTMNGAVSQLYAQMAGQHRAKPTQINIISANVVKKTDAGFRPNVDMWRDARVKYPVLKRSIRPSERKYHTIIKASRP